MKVVSIIGARPQFIKCAPVSRELHRQGAVEVLVHTGQHYDDSMSGVFFRELDIAAPNYHLGVGSGAHGQQTGEMLKGLEVILQKERPDVVLLYGDTNSTLAGALAAAQLHRPVAHVEAGVRSFNRRMPEEINRVITDRLSALLLCPTTPAVDNLRREGIVAGVHLVGDVMYDALWDTVDQAAHHPAIFKRLGVQPGDYILATVHRAENTDRLERLEGIIAALVSLVRSGRTIVFPVHPRTRNRLASLTFHHPERLLMIDPLSYREMVLLEAKAQLIVTDSGGIQKEAFWLGVPCITLRDETEWIDTVESGWNCLVGAQPDRIVSAVHKARPGRVDEWPWKRGEASQSISQMIIGQPFNQTQDDRVSEWLRQEENFGSSHFFGLAARTRGE